MQKNLFNPRFFKNNTMPHEPFPHMLSFPKGTAYPDIMKSDIVRIVSPNIAIGDKIPLLTAVGKDNMRKEWTVTEILSDRPAKGDWTNWKASPNHYEVKMKMAE
jgi:hypothetical protein